ncbi:beta-N-acetylhexosaminidase [Vibrio tasmaniensis]|nr:beta-N-acetylhexosaminidase [Vibrio tasmaniensis]
MLKKSLLAICCFAALSGCGSPSHNTTQTKVDMLADNLDMSFEIVTNYGNENGIACAELKADYASCNLVNIVLTNDGSQVNIEDWSIYFHSIRPVLENRNKEFKVTHITGDLHKIEPSDHFTGFQKNKTHTIPIISEAWQVSYTDFMPRAFVFAKGAEAKNIASTDTEDLTMFVKGLDQSQVRFSVDDNNPRSTAESRFENNQDMIFREATGEILPTPKHVEFTGSYLPIIQGLNLDSLPISDSTKQAVINQADMMGISNLESGININVQYQNAELIKDKESYQLEINSDSINIVAIDEIGVFYAMQSLLNVYDPFSRYTIPTMKVVDAPRFEYRGFMVDVGRNFHSKDTIFKTIEQMAAFKMNKLHLHMGEDEGWRLEIPGLPELTEIGSQRCFNEDEQQCLMPQLGSGANNDNFGSGYFTRQDYIDILQYAKAHKIEVIPEFDMPAHARAAVMSMEARYQKYMNLGDVEKAEQYRLLDPQDESNVTTVQFYNRQSFINPCLESSTQFVNKVITEVKSMHEEAGMPLTQWHFGGDEAKNIKLGNGFQDINDAPQVGKGQIDLSKEHKPYEKSPQCLAKIESGEIENQDALLSYFAIEVSKLLKEQNVSTFQAWQDGLKYVENSDALATDNTRVNLWDTVFWGASDASSQLVNDGYQVVLSNPDHIYLDMPYEVDEHERGYYWATRASDTRKMFSYTPENLPQNAELAKDRNGDSYTAKGTLTPNQPVYGLSAALWSETIRTDAQYEYMAFPRLMAVAERAWNKAEWELEYQADVEYSSTTERTNMNILTDDWSRFASILGQRELAKTEMRDITYRLPVPGGKILQGKLHMNSQFPGLSLEYSTDNGQSWHVYLNASKPSVESSVLVRSVSHLGHRTSRAIEVPYGQ